MRKNTDESMREYIEKNIKERWNSSRDVNPDLGRWFNKMNETNFVAGDNFSVYHAIVINGLVYIKKFVDFPEE